MKKSVLETAYFNPKAFNKECQDFNSKPPSLWKQGKYTSEK
jgi:hypothetical protein